jgi:hypothetical protein
MLGEVGESLPPRNRGSIWPCAGLCPGWEDGGSQAEWLIPLVYVRSLREEGFFHGGWARAAMEEAQSW